MKDKKISEVLVFVNSANEDHLRKFVFIRGSFFEMHSRGNFSRERLCFSMIAPQL